MKRNLLLFAVAFLFAAVGVQTAKAYSTSDLTSAGWTKVTSLTDVDNYYYVLVSKTKDCMVGRNGELLYYQTSVDPITDLNKVWTINVNGNYHSLRNVGFNDPRFVQTEYNAAWNLDFNDQWNLIGWSNFMFSYMSDGDYWYIENGTYPHGSDAEFKGYWGPWNEGGEYAVADGMRIAGNKLGGNVGQFEIYQFEKEAFNSLLVKNTNNYPIPFTEAIVVNPYITTATGWTCEKPNGGNGPLLNNNSFEYWQENAANGSFDYYQTLTLPNGVYTVSAYMFNSTNGVEGASVNGACGVYATSGETTVFTPVTTDGTTLTKYTTDQITVTNGSLRLGVKNNDQMSARWFVADNIMLTFIKPAISAIAEALPTTDMTADKWYYFDVQYDGEYILSSASGIVYTQDAGILFENESSVTDTWENTNVNLTAGRYFVKSSTAQTLTIQPNSFTYTVDEATANVSYIQPKKEVIVTFNVATDDPDANISTNFESVRFNGNSINIVSIDNGFKFKVPDEINVGTNTLSIPAGVIGYVDGETFNEAQEIVFNTPALFDSEGYFYNVETGKFLSRGANWGTKAVVDNYGTPALILTDGTNNSTIHFLDNDLFLGSDGFTDKATTFNNITWNIAAVNGGYTLTNTDGRPLVIEDGSVNLVAGSTAAVWVLKTKEEQQTIVNAAKAANALVVAKAAGFESAEAMTSALDNYTAIDVTSYINSPTSGSTTDWEWGTSSQRVHTYNTGNYGGEFYQSSGWVSQTINVEKAGIYKLSLMAMRYATR